MQDLETHLGTKLIERTTRALTVTEVGAGYLERAVRIVAEVEDMDNSVGSTRASVKGRIRVDVGSSLANLILVPALTDFHKQYPDIELQLGIGDRRVDLIGEGVDCVIRAGDSADKTLVERRLCELDWVTCASPLYLEGRARPTHPDELRTGHQIVSYFSAASGRTAPLRFFRDAEHIEFVRRSSVSVNESTAHLTSLRAGLGIAQTYGFMARPLLKSGELIELLPDWKPKNDVLNLVYPSTRFPSQKFKAFCGWAAALFSTHDRGGK